MTTLLGGLVMPKILILDNKSIFLDRLRHQTKISGAQPTLAEPLADPSLDDYDGIIISGGNWKTSMREERRRYIFWYKENIPKMSRPVLGICQGLLLMAWTYGAVFSRLDERDRGFREIAFNRKFPLAPNAKKLKLYKSSITAVDSLNQDSLLSYASSTVSSCEAAKHMSKDQYGVLPHIEVTENGAPSLIIKNFVSLCR